MAQVIKFLKEVKIELIKVTWPQKEELVGSTAVVLVLSIILAIFIGIADAIINKIVFFILTR
jgi:preprotein translocase subunit SecE